MVDGTRSALIVASDEYADPGLGRLRAPASDAEALAAVLRDPGIGGFEVRTLLNAPAHEVNLAVEEFFADRRPDDLLLLHFSGHGVKDEGGELYFAAANTRLRMLGSTAVAAEFVNRRMGRSRSRRVVLLLDCCYAGAFERGMTARAGSGVGIEEHFGGRGRAVITASSAMEYAFEGDQLTDARAVAPSVFTSALVEGLRTGDADRDQDGYVALDELYDYVYDRVREATPNQTPGKWTFGVQGELVIARRGRPVTTPASLPPELRGAIDSPFAGVRAGAVQELARLLRGQHAGLALAAKLTLRQLTDDDSRRVAAAATEVLANEAPAVAVAQVPPPAQMPPAAAEVPSALQVHPASAPVPAGVEAPAVADPPASPPVAEAPASAPEADAVVPAQVAEAPGPAVVPAPPPAATEAPPVASSAPKQAPAGRGAAAVPRAASPAPAPREAKARAGAAATAEPAATATPGPARTTTAGVAAAVPPVAGPAAPPDRLGRLAGQLAIAAAALLVAGLFPSYQWSAPLSSVSPEAVAPTLILAALAATAGACTLVPRTQRVVGPGLLLGAAPAAISGLISLIVRKVSEDGFGSGFTLLLVADLVFILAACLAGFALVGTARARLGGLPSERLRWLVALLGAVGAVPLAIFAARVSDLGKASVAAPVVLMVAMALVVPACVALAVPRQFAVALLAGWIGGAASAAVYYFGAALVELNKNGYDLGRGQIATFGATLLGLAVVAVLLARAPDATADPARVG
ncbi:MAG TPA: caspase family protein [Actinomycetota bacterium]